MMIVIAIFTPLLKLSYIIGESNNMEIIERSLFAGLLVTKYRVITYKSKLGIVRKWIKLEEDKDE
jgi:hypothetical protein